MEERRPCSTSQGVTVLSSSPKDYVVNFTWIRFHSPERETLICFRIFEKEIHPFLVSCGEVDGWRSWSQIGFQSESMAAQFQVCDVTEAEFSRLSVEKWTITLQCVYCDHCYRCTHSRAHSLTFLSLYLLCYHVSYHKMKANYLWTLVSLPKHYRWVFLSNYEK